MNGRSPSFTDRKRRRSVGHSQFFTLSPNSFFDFSSHHFCSSMEPNVIPLGTCGQPSTAYVAANKVWRFLRLLMQAIFSARGVTCSNAGYRVATRIRIMQMAANISRRVNPLAVESLAMVEATLGGCVINIHSFGTNRSYTYRRGANIDGIKLSR